jgi:hypothetical protein
MDNQNPYRLTPSLYSDGYGALIIKPNQPNPNLIKTNTYAQKISQQYSSSLPYINTSNPSKEIFKLQLEFAKQRKYNKVDYIYTDKEYNLLENRLTGDMIRVSKIKETSNEDLLKNFLLGEIQKRKKDEQDILNKRLTGVLPEQQQLEKEIEKFRTNQEIQRRESEMAKHANSINQYKEELKGLLSPERRNEINNKIQANNKNLLDNIQVLEAKKEKIPNLADNLNSLKKNIDINPELNRIKNIFVNLSDESLSQKIRDSGLIMYPNATKEDKINLLTALALNLNPKTRDIVSSLNLEIPYAPLQDMKKENNLIFNLIETAKNKEKNNQQLSREIVQINNNLKAPEKISTRGGFRQGSGSPYKGIAPILRPILREKQKPGPKAQILTSQETAYAQPILKEKKEEPKVEEQIITKPKKRGRPKKNIII